MKRLLFIAFPYLLLLFGNVNFKEDFYLARAEYYFESPNGQQVLTFISVENIFETIFGDKMKSGIYMFIGHIDSSSKLPDEFLKLKYTYFPSASRGKILYCFLMVPLKKIGLKIVVK